MLTTRSFACWLTLSCALMFGTGARAHAQACHAPDLHHRHQRDEPFRASIAMLAATYDVGGYAGNYQGLYATFAYNQPWYGAEVLLPAYRLDRRQGIEYGLGDMMVTLRGTLFRAREGNMVLGVELPLMLPTGDADRELGMGRVMPMPDVYFSLRMHPLFLRAQVGYGHMIGGMHGHTSSEHAHHGASGMKNYSPLVNPMNMHELEHQLLVGFVLPHEISVHARWWGAVPIMDDMGVLRQAVAAGATATLSRFDITFELQRTITGRAFEWKPLLQVGAVF